MIESIILAALRPLQSVINTLVVRITSCENRHGISFEVTTLKAEVADLINDTNYINSTNISSLIRRVHALDAHETLGIPSATTGDTQRDGTADDELEAGNDDESTVVQKEERISGNLMGDILQHVHHTSSAGDIHNSPQRI